MLLNIRLKYRKLRFFIKILCFAIGLYCLGLITKYFTPDITDEYFQLCDPFPTDFIEYHLPAANLALNGVFPYFGFLDDYQAYKLCETEFPNDYHKILLSAPAIVFPSKPPVYSFFLGIFYKYFGYRPQTYFYLNYFILSLLLFLAIVGCYLLYHNKSVLPIIGTILLMIFVQTRLSALSAELLTSFIAFAVFIVSIFAFKQKSFFLHLLSGALFSLLLLTKGIFVFALFFMLSFYAFVLLNNKMVSDIKNLLFFVLGGLLVALPWWIHINMSIQNDLKNRNAFHQVLKFAAPKLMFDSRDEIFQADGNYRIDVIQNLMLFHQYQHAIENDFVFITNQLGEYNILNVHNEYCTDGDFHPEWRIIYSSFYNKHLEKSKNVKLLLFYIQKPLLGVKITVAKLINSFDSKTIVFWVSLTVLLFFSIKRRPSIEMLMALFFKVNVFLVLIVFYGDVRFIYVVLPVSIFSLINVFFAYLKKD